MNATLLNINKESNEEEEEEEQCELGGGGFCLPAAAFHPVAVPHVN